ncbi:hypothetical protein D3C77_685310 [compost metagenome]
MALIVHHAEVVLRNGMPLLGRLAVPDYGQSIILLHPLATAIHPAELGLRHGSPFLSHLNDYFPCTIIPIFGHFPESI